MSGLNLIKCNTNELTPKGKEALKEAERGLRMSMGVLIIGIMILIVFLGFAVGTGGSAFTDPFFYKDMGLPIALMLTGLVLLAADAYKFHREFTPKEKKEYFLMSIMMPNVVADNDP